MRAIPLYDDPPWREPLRWGCRPRGKSCFGCFCHCSEAPCFAGCLSGLGHRLVRDYRAAGQIHFRLDRHQSGLPRDSSSAQSGRDDPHGPRWSFFWGHLECICTEDQRHQILEPYSRYVPDLMGDKFLRWLHHGNKWLVVWTCRVGALAALGFLTGFLLCGDSVEVFNSASGGFSRLLPSA